MRSRTSPYRQSGAALVVGLVLLMVLTLLAVSTMRSAALEMLMAGNAQSRENAFRLAEAGIADALARAPALLTPVPGWTATIGPQGVDGLRGSYEVDIEYLSTSRPFTGFSEADYEFNFYELDAIGRTDRGARSLQSQGIIYVGRKIDE